MNNDQRLYTNSVIYVLTIRYITVGENCRATLKHNFSILCNKDYN
jgi:hypothetical protein